MSLKFFHVVFVTVTTTVLLVGARWASECYKATHRSDMKITMDLCLVSAVAMVIYGVWFYRKLKKNPRL